MIKRRQVLINNEIYHIIVRGVADSIIFKDIADYYRAIFSIYEFNTTKPVEIRNRRDERKSKNPIPADKDPLVEVLLFCLMPNHIHLLLRQIKDGGITKFMNKFGAGYPRYFREKHNLKNKGYFFQGRFKSVHIETEAQLRVVFVYIHTNPISLIEPKWKEKGIGNTKKVINFLENYKWSSYLDYIDKKNFSSVTKRNFMLELMNNASGCKDAVENWVTAMKKDTEGRVSAI